MVLGKNVDIDTTKCLKVPVCIALVMKLMVEACCHYSYSVFVMSQRLLFVPCSIVHSDLCEGSVRHAPTDHVWLSTDPLRHLLAPCGHHGSDRYCTGQVSTALCVTQSKHSLHSKQRLVHCDACLISVTVDSVCVMTHIK